MDFLNKNKVLILGLLSAIALAVYELMKSGESSSKVLAFAAALAATSWMANNLRGQWATIAGVVGTAISTYLTMEQQGTISWAQLILQIVIALLAVVSGPAKSRAYESTSTIASAKAEAERKQPSMAKP